MLGRVQGSAGTPTNKTVASSIFVAIANNIFGALEFPYRLTRE